MKRALLFLLSFCILNSLFAQWNYVSGASGPIYYAGGLVGIGTNSPGYGLDVNGSIHSSNTTYADSYSAGQAGLYVRGGSSGIKGDMIIQGYNSQAYWISGATNYLYIGGNGGTEPSQGAINIDYLGNVGIGTLNTGNGYKLAVNGTAVLDGVTVTTFSSNNPRATPWADFVFEKGYQLPSLQSVAAYIATNHHLAGIPTTAEVRKSGVDLGANQAKLLEKIEQLTLYAIDQKDRTDSLATENEKLRQITTAQDRRLTVLEQEVNSLKNMIKQNQLP